MNQNLMALNGLSPELVDIIVGTMLGDAKMTFSFTSGNAAYICEQSSVHKDYLFHLFDLFKDFTDKVEPVKYTRVDARNGVTSTSYYFNTVALPIFIQFAKMFYTEVAGTRKVIKVVPSNIYDLLTPRALAYWIMDDGMYVKRGGVTLCTDSFTKAEVGLLKGVLESKFGFICQIHHKGANQRIYISGKSLGKLTTMVKPFMHESFMYKLAK